MLGSCLFIPGSKPKIEGRARFIIDLLAQKKKSSLPNLRTHIKKRSLIKHHIITVYTVYMTFMPKSVESPQS